MRYPNVPMILQEKSDTCWHASARMVWAFKYKQSINPQSALFKDNQAISPAQFIDLAKQLGMKSVPVINRTYEWNGLEELLKLHGPLWVAGYWYGLPHVIVVTGIDPDGTLYVNDPGFGPKVHNIQFFNEKIASDVGNPIMYLPNSVANHDGYENFFG